MKIKSSIIVLVVMTILSGCTDVLDKHNLNSVNDQIWDNEGTATLYLNKLYEDNMPGMSLGEDLGRSDESYTSSESVTNLVYGYVDNTDLATTYVGRSTDVFHKDNYVLIRQINLCIDGMKESALSDSVCGIILGQAYFLRAYRYWEIIKLYGGVPMVLHAQDPFFENMDMARNTTSECIDLLVEDLDYAIANLPDNWDATNLGRITRGAVAAYKGRILLNWASPMFNPNNEADRWQRAYDANKEAMEMLAAAGRGLHPDFSTIFTTSASTNVEAVLFKLYNANAGNDYATSWESTIRPRSGGGSGSSNPTWNLVKAFPMANGKWISDPTSGYDSTFYWKNRDPRFYATIAYNGCTWKMEGKDTEIQWTYDRNIQENNSKPGTGFYCKKASDPTLPMDKVKYGSATWHELRYAEVLLNFAECANEVGKPEEAIEQLKRIRERAGIEPGEDGNYGLPAGGSQNEILEAVIHERQIEFAFENKRYWDLRRRTMFRNDLGPNTPKLNGTQRYGMLTSINAKYSRVITDQTSPYYGWKAVDTAAYFGSIDINDNAIYNQYFKTTIRSMEVVLNEVSTPINYLPLYDFFAVPSAMLQSCDSIKQTIGWFDGSFDPLK